MTLTHGVHMVLTAGLNRFASGGGVVIRFWHVGLFHGNREIGRLGRNGLGDAMGFGWQGFVDSHVATVGCATTDKSRVFIYETHAPFRLGGVSDSC